MNNALLRYPKHWSSKFSSLVRDRATGEQAATLIRLEQQIFRVNGGDKRATAREFEKKVEEMFPQWGHIPETWQTRPVISDDLTYFEFEAFDQLPIFQSVIS